MKYFIFAIALVLVGGLMLSFKSSSALEEITITVTSGGQAEFDMYQNLNSKDFTTRKDLKTPYQLKLSTADAKFIFKLKTGSKLKIEVVQGNHGLTAEWPVTVVLVEDSRLTTFGMD